MFREIEVDDEMETCDESVILLVCCRIFLTIILQSIKEFFPFFAGFSPNLCQLMHVYAIKWDLVCDKTRRDKSQNFISKP